MNPTSRFRKFSVCPYCKNEKDCSEENTKSVDEQLFDKETMDVIHGLNQPFQQKAETDGNSANCDLKNKTNRREQRKTVNMCYFSRKRKNDTRGDSRIIRSVTSIMDPKGQD